MPLFDNPPDKSKYIPLYGDTYPIKDKLKSMGGYWDNQEKVWMIPENMIEFAQKELDYMQSELTSEEDKFWTEYYQQISKGER